MSDTLLVLFATMTGTAEDCAGRAAKRLQALGYLPRLVNMRDIKSHELHGAETLLIVASTWGEGEPPDDAVPFWDEVKKLPEGTFAGMRYAVLALGDSSYEHFCGFGRECDATLERLGALRFHPRLDCDNDHEESFDGWIEHIALALNGGQIPNSSRASSSF